MSRKPYLGDEKLLALADKYWPTIQRLNKDVRTVADCKFVLALLVTCWPRKWGAAAEMFTEVDPFVPQLLEHAKERVKQRRRAEVRGKQTTEEAARTREAVREAQARLREKLRREPTDKELARESHLSVATIRRHRQSK